ncbi:hypothetical protein FB639_004199, partial [Coemansia asiatica]
RTDTARDREQDEAAHLDDSDTLGNKQGGSSAFTRPPQQHPLKQLNGDRDLVARPIKPPTTSKPFNPFGVVSPSKSMEIKRSDSFFNSADIHSHTLSRDSSSSALQLANNNGASSSSSSKRGGGGGGGGGGHQLGEPFLNEEDDGAPRSKVAKKSRNTTATTTTTAQSKLSAFAFKKDAQKQQSLLDG